MKIVSNLADAIVADKTGKRMPGVKKLRQEPGDNRPEFLMGHFWGALTALLQAGPRYFALPLRFEFQDGIKRSPSEKATTITRMATLMTETGDDLQEARRSDRGDEDRRRPKGRSPQSLGRGMRASRTMEANDSDSANSGRPISLGWPPSSRVPNSGRWSAPGWRPPSLAPCSGRWSATT
ncbi:MAG: hypothetical protein JXB05_07095, partial [Myxococcaceae bacterium]|nr:hypothetical protein [Myxococcaceae bacterium]